MYQRQHTLREAEYVYNITVKGNSNYFVVSDQCSVRIASLSLLVHNAYCDDFYVDDNLIANNAKRSIDKGHFKKIQKEVESHIKLSLERARRDGTVYSSEKRSGRIFVDSKTNCVFIDDGNGEAVHSIVQTNL